MKSGLDARSQYSVSHNTFAGGSPQRTKYVISYIPLENILGSGESHTSLDSCHCHSRTKSQVNEKIVRLSALCSTPSNHPPIAHPNTSMHAPKVQVSPGMSGWSSVTDSTVSKSIAIPAGINKRPLWLIKRPSSI